MITKSIPTMTTHRISALKETQAKLWEISNMSFREMLRLCSDPSLSPPYVLDSSIYISPSALFWCVFDVLLTSCSRRVIHSYSVISHTAK